MDYLKIIGDIVRPNPLLEELSKQGNVNPNFIKSVLNSENLFSCDHCGAYDPCDKFYSVYRFCSDECLSNGIKEIEEIHNADKYDSMRDIEMENFKEHLNESKEFEL